MSARRSLRLRSEGPPGGWWSPGTHEPTGHLFGETPGVKRVWEDWEMPWYFTLVAATVMLGVGLSAKPDTSLVNWAHKEAAKRLEAELETPE